MMTLRLSYEERWSIELAFGPLPPGFFQFNGQNQTPIDRLASLLNCFLFFGLCTLRIRKQDVIVMAIDFIRYAQQFERIE